jgi:hypothetical protein
MGIFELAKSTTHRTTYLVTIFGVEASVTVCSSYVAEPASILHINSIVNVYASFGSSHVPKC